MFLLRDVSTSALCPTNADIRRILYIQIHISTNTYPFILCRRNQSAIFNKTDKRNYVFLLEIQKLLSLSLSEEFLVKLMLKIISQSAHLHILQRLSLRYDMSFVKTVYFRNFNVYFFNLREFKNIDGTYFKDLFTSIGHRNIKNLNNVSGKCFTRKHNNIRWRNKLILINSNRIS